MKPQKDSNSKDSKSRHDRNHTSKSNQHNDANNTAKNNDHTQQSLLDLSLSNSKKYLRNNHKHDIPIKVSKHISLIH